jgi:outer membrane protein OmpA-like peptidoglycan-associated protein
MRHPRGIAPVLALGLGVVCLGAGAAAAQEGPQASVEYNPDFDPEQFQASADPDQIGLVDGARTQPTGTLSVGLVLNLAGPPLDIRVHDRACDPAVNPECKTITGDILNARLRADLGVLYGLGRFDARLTLPLVLAQSSDFDPQMGAEPLGGSGVGNPRLGLRAQILKRGAVALAGDVAVQLPTGGQNFIGDDALVIDPRLLFDVHAGKLWAGVNLGYRYRGGAEGSHIANLYVDDELTWSAAAQYWIRERALAVGAAAYGRVGIMDAPTDLMDVPGVVQELGAEERPAELLGSLRWFVTHKIAVELGGGTALSPGYGAPPFRVLAGVRWSDRRAEARPLVSDRDHDGIDDADDRCPEAPEDVDGFEDLDGCPDPDNDDDGVVDAADQCPMVGEDADGFQDRDGCPDEDNDGDRVLDAADGCPNEAEDLDTFKDEDGCPEADADGDGLEDADDECPLVAEVYNGIADEDGCADAGPPLAILDQTAVVVNDRIYFDLNRARIKTRSQPVLDAVAAILRAHSHLRVRIEGHTDDQGAPDWNRTLSQLRSERVREYLIEKGIAPDRLEAHGYGYDRPLVNDTSEAARDQNRRVEFVIVDRGGAETRSGEELPVPAGPDAPDDDGDDGDD